MVLLCGNFCRCLPDASLAFQGFIDEQSRLNHQLQVRGPVARDIGGLLHLDVAQTQSHDSLFYIENSILNLETNGEQVSCYEGHVNRLRSLHFQDEGQLTGVKTSGYGNTCEESMVNNLSNQSFVILPHE